MVLRGKDDTLRYTRALIKTPIALTRKLDLTHEAVKAAEDPSARSQHASEMLYLDRDKFSLAKNINEAEATTHALEARLENLRKELALIQSEEEGVIDAPSNSAEDGTL